MARRSGRISSDPEFLLGLMEEMSDDSDNGFDGYISDNSDDELAPTPDSKLYMQAIPYHVYRNSSTTL